MWTCSTCQRTFKNTHQEHSCEVTDLATHFLNKSENVTAVFEKLNLEVSAFGDFTINSVKHAILFTSKSHFLAVKPKRKWLDIEFVLPYPIEGFPVHKSVQVSKSKWAHFVRLESVEEIDKQLVSWLNEAYKISG